jgi:hypothetical protein
MAIKINATVSGTEKVFARLNKELLAVEGRTYNGMYEAVKFLENQMDTIQPLVPEDTKAMRKSWYILGSKRAMNPTINAGYRAYYAPIVHEMGQNVNWTRKGSGPKWLQIHFARNIQQMKLIIAANARIKDTGWYGGYGTAASKPLSQRKGNETGTFDL